METVVINGQPQISSTFGNRIVTYDGLVDFLAMLKDEIPRMGLNNSIDGDYIYVFGKSNQAASPYGFAVGSGNIIYKSKEITKKPSTLALGIDNHVQMDAAGAGIGLGYNNSVTSDTLTGIAIGAENGIIDGGGILLGNNNTIDGYSVVLGHNNSSDTIGGTLIGKDNSVGTGFGFHSFYMLGYDNQFDTNLTREQIDQLKPTLYVLGHGNKFSRDAQMLQGYCLGNYLEAPSFLKEASLSNLDKPMLLIGQYNLLGTKDAPKDYKNCAFCIAGGTSDNDRRNIFEITYDGDIRWYSSTANCKRLIVDNAELKGRLGYYKLTDNLAYSLLNGTQGYMAHVMKGIGDSGSTALWLTNTPSSTYVINPAGSDDWFPGNIPTTISFQKGDAGHATLECGALKIYDSTKSQIAYISSNGKLRCTGINAHATGYATPSPGQLLCDSAIISGTIYGSSTLTIEGSITGQNNLTITHNITGSYITAEQSLKTPKLQTFQHVVEYNNTSNKEFLIPVPGSEVVLYHCDIVSTNTTDTFQNHSCVFTVGFTTSFIGYSSTDKRIVWEDPDIMVYLEKSSSSPTNYIVRTKYKQSSREGSVYIQRLIRLATWGEYS